jgi:hypothetical protein
MEEQDSSGRAQSERERKKEKQERARKTYVTREVGLPARDHFFAHIIADVDLYGITTHHITSHSSNDSSSFDTTQHNTAKQSKAHTGPMVYSTSSALASA